MPVVDNFNNSNDCGEKFQTQDDLETHKGTNIFFLSRRNFFLSRRKYQYCHQSYGCTTPCPGCSLPWQRGQDAMCAIVSFKCNSVATVKEFIYSQIWFIR